MHKLEERTACISPVTLPIMNIDNPEVSVVIPTRGRPELLLRATAGALDQGFRNLEVVVVIDGPDPATSRALETVRDHRLRVIALAENVGGSQARNVGVLAARGEWIALLDDDDEWMPGKIAVQLAAAASATKGFPVIACRFFERTESSQRVLPSRIPRAREDFSEYTFVRRGWSSAEGFLQTSTWLVRKELLLKVPFRQGLKRCQDLDWLLRATAHPETELIVAPETLAVFHHDERNERVSRTPDWKYLFDWATGNRAYFSARAFAFFIATFCVPSAEKEKAGPGALLFLLWKCLETRAMTFKCLLLFVTFWLLPEARRRSVRAAMQKLAELSSGIAYRLNPGLSRTAR